MIFTDRRQLPLATDALQGGGFRWRAVLVGEKPGAACRWYDVTPDDVTPDQRDLFGVET